MTISSSVSKATLNGDGVQTKFPFAFKVWKAGDLEVSITSPAGANTVVTDWTVELAGSGGTVTYPTVGDPLPLGWMITIRRLMDFLQDVDLVSGTRFDPEVIETALDIATAERQQLLEEISRTVRVGVASGEDPANVVNQVFEARDAAVSAALVAEASANLVGPLLGPEGSSLVGFVQDGTSAVATTVQAKLREFVSVKDFGAKGDGVTDDTGAIRAAIRAVVAGSAFTADRDPTGSLYFPQGIYRITENGLFSDYNDIKRQGVLCFGDGPGNSIIWMDPSGLAGNTWFYDNASTNRAWGMSFRDLGFSGGISRDQSLTYTNFDSKCNGFKFSGPGWESSASFFNCTFSWLATVLQCSGSNSADTHILTDCEFFKCKDIVVLDNLQSFNVQLESCYGSLIWGDIARWTANANGGAGNFRINGGAYIMIPDDWGGGTCSIINCASGGPSAGNGNVGVRDARFELRGNGSAIGNFTNGYPMFLFENCSFLKSGATAPTTWATNNIYESVVFRDCSFVPTSGQWPVLVVNGSSRFGKNGTYLFDNCFLSGWDDWTLTFTNNFGHIITRNCFSSLADTVGEPGVREINGEVRGTESTSTTGRSRPMLAVNPLKGNTLPIGNGTNEATISLPRGATLVRVHIHLPAGAAGATGSTWRLRVGSNDKSVVYAETTAAAQNAGFTLDKGVYIKLGTAVVDRTVRVWADNGAGGSIAAGAPSPTYAALEYV